jgi:hypothetical protein
VTIDEITSCWPSSIPATPLAWSRPQTKRSTRQSTSRCTDTRWVIQLTQDGGAAINEYGIENDGDHPDDAADQ